MSDDFKVFDTEGRPLEIGTRVKLWNATPDGGGEGVIVSIGDFDVDEDRICYPPVEVRFDDGDTESFGTYERGYWPHDSWPDVECEELDNIEPGRVQA